MSAKLILTRALSCIEAEGFHSKKTAAINGAQPTSAKVMESLAIRPEFGDDDCRYESKAEDIIDWVTNLDTSTSDFLTSCKGAITLAETCPGGAVGYLAALCNTYKDHLEAISGYDKVTQPSSFAGKVGDPYDSEAIVLNYKTYSYGSSYARVASVDTNGHLITYTISPNKQNKLIVPPVGGKIHVTGRVSALKGVIPYETLLNRTKVRLIDDNKI
jgi:hypothetical protein